MAGVLADCGTSWGRRAAAMPAGELSIADDAAALAALARARCSRSFCRRFELLIVGGRGTRSWGGGGERGLGGTFYPLGHGGEFVARNKCAFYMLSTCRILSISCLRNQPNVHIKGTATHTHIIFFSPT